MNTEIRIDNKLIFKDFNEHINIEGNDRILFSAPFGTGKSTFLTEYFDENKDKYFCFNLYPVNYSVSQNEDIFELIKFDLLLQLMGNYRDEINLQNEDFSNILSFQALFLKEIKLTPILLALLEEGGKIGKSAKILIDEVKKQYDNYKKQFNDEEKFIEQYLEQIESKVGNVNEMDGYSTIILNLLKRLKNKFSDKKAVLIIDDLDRLDPEHIFRLFNIFSLNFGKEEILNKFGFDKIIFVCDIENIRNIYAHKYGENVDFSGYIDKFYSIIPFEFDNKKLIIKVIDNGLKHLKYFNNEDYFKDKANIYYNEFFNVTKAFVISLLRSKIINLRSLINTNIVKKKNERFQFHKRRPLFRNEFDLLNLFDLIANFVGTYAELRNSIVKLEKIYDYESLNSQTNEDYYDDEDIPYVELISYCLPFLVELNGLGNTIFNNGEDQGTIKIVRYENNLSVIIYWKLIRRSLRRETISFLEAKNPNSLTENVVLNPFKILLLAFDECVKRGAIVL